MDGMINCVSCIHSVHAELVTVDCADNVYTVVMNFYHHSDSLSEDI